MGVPDISLISFGIGVIVFFDLVNYKYVWADISSISRVIHPSKYLEADQKDRKSKDSSEIQISERTSPLFTVFLTLLFASLTHSLHFTVYTVFTLKFNFNFKTIELHCPLP
uniref:Uncharacterized protein n=1 Tax=Cacopsylla melanoneura TaxID=428564 RepID=A0A8D8Q4L6_9HEMI